MNAGVPKLLSFFRKGRTGFALGWLLSPLVLSVAAAQMAVTNLYVATNGSDSNPGTLSQPFLTLAKAQEAERALGTNIQRNIYIRGGQYYNVTMLMQQGYGAGADDSYTQWIGYPGDPAAVLYGGQPLTNWTATSNGWWVASLPAFPSDSLNASVNELPGWEVRMLLVDGQMATRAQYPTNGSSLSYTSTWEQTNCNYFTFNSGDIPAALIATNADVMIDQSWQSADPGVASIDFATLTVNLTFPPQYGFQFIPDIQTYRIYNTVEGMANPGQFYFDRANDLVVYYPIGGKNPNTSQIIVPTTDRMWYFNGYFHSAHNVTFSNLTCLVNAVDREPECGFGYCWNHVSLFHLGDNSGVQNLSWQNCKLGWCGGNAIGGDYGFCTNCSVINSEVGFTGGSAVVLCTGPLNVVSNNYLHDTGILCYQCPAVRVTTNSIVIQNNIFNCRQSAIANHDVDQCQFLCNSISNCMFVNEDMGAYYEFFGDPGSGAIPHPHGNILQSNLFQQVGTNFNVSGGQAVNFYRPAMYFDEGSSNNLVADNITIGCPTPFFANVGTSNAINNNVFINTNVVPNYFGLRLYVDMYNASPYSCTGNVWYAATNFIIGEPGLPWVISGSSVTYAQSSWQASDNSWQANVFWSTMGLTNGTSSFGVTPDGLIPTAGSLKENPDFASGPYPPLAYSANSPVPALGIIPLTFVQQPLGVGNSGENTNLTAPVITWSSPAAIAYGTALVTNQLDATADVAGTFSYSPAAGTVLSAGTQTLSAAFTPSNTALYSTATATVPLTISPAPLSVTAVSQTNLYGAALPVFTASYSGFVNGDTAASLSTLPVLASTATAASPVGTYGITAGGAADSNYTFSYVPGALTVTPAPLTITANNQTMAVGGSMPALTAAYSGFVNGDSAANLSTPPALATAATASSPAGAYPITVGGAADSNYTITYVNGTLTVVASPIQTVLTWAAPAAISYGTALSTIQLDATASAPGSFSYSRAPGTVLCSGTHALSVTFTPSNSALYTGATASNTITVQKAPLTIMASNMSKTYGSPVPVLGCSYLGFVNGDTPTNLTTPVWMATDCLSNSAAGAYWIAANSATSSNYSIAYVGATLTVTPAPLTIAANCLAMTAGSCVPVLTASYSGFVLGNTASNLTKQATLATTATSNSPAGTYPITASGASSSNYSIAYVAGALTVTGTNPPAGVIITGAAVNPGGQMQISLSGQTGQAYVLDASADLVNWIPLVTNSLAAPGGSFADPIPAGTAWRFYRIDPSNP